MEAVEEQVSGDDFNLDHELTSQSKPAVECEDSQSKQMSLADTVIAISSVRAISAEGNYVRILTDAKDYFLRAVFNEVILQLPKEIGTQIHRSHWVAYRAIDEINRDGRKMTVRLTDGNEFPVSRARQTELVGGSDMPAPPDINANG